MKSLLYCVFVAEKGINRYEENGKVSIKAVRNVEVGEIVVLKWKNEFVSKWSSNVCAFVWIKHFICLFFLRILSPTMVKKYLEGRLDLIDTDFMVQDNKKKTYEYEKSPLQLDQFML